MKVWYRQLVIVVTLSLLLFVTACGGPSEPPSRFEQTQIESTQRGAKAIVEDATQGAKFNQFFPKAVEGYQIVPAQEKQGFAEYKVNQSGQNVAVLSISDTISLPAAAAKYQDSSLQIAGYPAVEQGTTGTGILVGDRYQVKVLSRDPAFSAADRAAWLEKFDLQGLASLATDGSNQAQLSSPKEQAPVLSPQPAN